MDENSDDSLKDMEKQRQSAEKKALIKAVRKMCRNHGYTHVWRAGIIFEMEDGHDYHDYQYFFCTVYDGLMFDRICVHQPGFTWMWNILGVFNRKNFCTIETAIKRGWINEMNNVPFWYEFRVDELEK
jgi:hypothetical protein